MIVHDMEQRSPEWDAIRVNRITGSEVGKFVYGTDKKSADARDRLIFSKIGDEADGEDKEPHYENYWMKRGTRLESEARTAYESYTGHEVEEVGFISHDFLPLGVSPDGLVAHRSHGLEMKCPRGRVQIERIIDGVCPAEYLSQIWMSLVVSGLPQWDFWSWHPNLPAFHARVMRSEVPAAFESGLYDLARRYERERMHYMQDTQQTSTP